MTVYRCDVCRTEYPAQDQLAHVMFRVDIPAALLKEWVPAMPPAKIVVEIDLCKESLPCKASGISQAVAEVYRQAFQAVGVPDKVAA